MRRSRRISDRCEEDENLSLRWGGGLDIILRVRRRRVSDFVGAAQ